MSNLFVVQVVVYGFALWFALYILGRSGGESGLISAGLGLLSYAGGVALANISTALPALGDLLAHRTLLLAVLPAVYWFGAAASLLPETERSDPSLRLFLRPVPLTLIGIGVLVVSAVSPLVTSLAPITFILIALWWTWQSLRGSLPRILLKLILTATLFFMLGLIMLIVPQAIVSNELALLGIGGDLLLLGYAVSQIKAYEEGAALLPELLPSLTRTLLASALVGGQFFVLLSVVEDLRGPLVLLFYTTLTTVIGLFTWQEGLQRRLDQFLFGRQARLTQERETLIAVAEALPRQNSALDVITMDESEFTRLTRRALSHYNDLSKLVASPLIQLPVVSVHLRDTGKPDTSLERAHALRLILQDHIEQLRPERDQVFDTGDDWRYYNALYFPYVLDLKPYAIKPLPPPADPIMQQARDWFQTYVPERTLYNWQTSAAKLIARQLRETTKLKIASSD